MLELINYKLQIIDSNLTKDKSCKFILNFIVIIGYIIYLVFINMRLFISNIMKQELNATLKRRQRQCLFQTIMFRFSKQTDLERLTKDPSKISRQIPQINKPRASDGGIYSVERVIHKQQASQQLKIRMEELRRKHELLRVQLTQKVNIPFLLCGVNRKTYHQSYGYLPERVMSYYKIHPTMITDYLFKIYKASLHAMIDKNQTLMEEYWEQGFRNEVMKSLEIAKNKGYNLKLTQEKKFVEEMKESCRIVDAVMFRGLSPVRSQNEHPSQYHKYSEQKQFGLITYTPLYLTNDNQKFANPETNKNIYQGYEKMIMRVLLLVKTPLRLTIPQIQVPQDLNTYEHLVVMQNEMVAPPHLQSRYKLQTLVEWLGKYRFGAWKVVDIDNFMKGNSIFRLHQKEQQIEQIFKNTILDKAYYCNIRNV